MQKVLTIITIFLLSAKCFASNNPFASGHYVQENRIDKSRYFANFYVATTGNDASGDGSIGNPWKTLYKATSTVTTAGSIISLGAGIFTETTQSTLAAGVSVEGLDSNSTTIRSSLTTDYTEIISARSGSENTNGNQSISYIRFDGQSRSTSWAIAVFARKNVSIYNCAFQNFDDQAIIFSGRTDYNETLQPTTYAVNNSVYNCSIVNCSKADVSYGRGAIRCLGQQTFSVYNCTIVQNSRPAGQNGYCIKFINYNKGVAVYNNTLIRDRFPYYTEGDNNHFSFSIEVGDMQGGNFYNNITTGSFDFNRCDKGAYTYSLWIHGNTFGNNSLSANQEVGIIIEYSNSDVIIENNTFKYLTNAFIISTHFNNNLQKRIYFQYNLCYGNGRSGGSGDAYVTTITDGLNNNAIDSFFFLHNTLVGDASFANPYTISVSNNYNGVTNFFIRDNIISGAGTATFLVSGDASFINGMYNTNNIIYGNGNSNAALWLSGTPTNYIVNGLLTTNPDLNTTADLYTLNTGSPAINSATDGTNRGHTGGTPPPDPGSNDVLLKKVRGKKLNH